MFEVTAEAPEVAAAALGLDDLSETLDGHTEPDSAGIMHMKAPGRPSEVEMRRTADGTWGSELYDSMSQQQTSPRRSLPSSLVPPIEGDKVYYDHVTLIKENGIYILETMNTGKLAENQVSEFMFVLGQPKIKGAVQMIINPIALW